MWPLALLVVLIALGAIVHRSSRGSKPHASAGPQATHRRTHTPPVKRATSPPVPVTRAVGQMIVSRFTSTNPSPTLLARARDGQLGGVILFADNFTGGPAQARKAITELQQAARAGGNPPLLVMTDQEGGEVSRVPGPPTLAPSEMTTSEIAYAQGQATGRLLRGIGVNVDLAPVADVERVTGSFLGTRAFGSTPAAVAAGACSFARGLASAQVAYTLKHFPGLGRASGNTDLAPVTIAGGPALLRSDYAAYRSCGGGPLALVMVSTAIYPSLTGPQPAVMSPLTYQRELPIATAGAHAVTISDDLQAAALANQTAPATHAINAGLDLLLYAQTEQASAGAYRALLQEARSGVLSHARISAAYEEIVALKHRIAHL